MEPTEICMVNDEDALYIGIDLDGPGYIRIVGREENELNQIALSDSIRIALNQSGTGQTLYMGDNEYPINDIEGLVDAINYVGGWSVMYISVSD